MWQALHSRKNDSTELWTETGNQQNTYYNKTDMNVDSKCVKMSRCLKLSTTHAGLAVRCCEEQPDWSFER